MASKYGLPYKGSKNTIAEWVVEQLPSAKVLVDLFCGGCAVTHAALLTGKWERVIANDIHADVPQLFLDAINGKYTTQTERRWISREDFFRLKDTDAYVRLCWSFGNDGCTYMYGRDIEHCKRELHELIFADTVQERMIAWRKLLERLQSLQSLESLQRLERLERLQSLQSLESLQRLEISGKDYREVEIPEDAVIYCDIPYECTKDCYGVKFDRAEFLDWADAQTAPVIISEYNIDDERFAVLAEREKVQMIAGAKYQKKVMERLYFPKKQLEMIRDRIGGQMDIFGEILA